MSNEGRLASVARSTANQADGYRYVTLRERPDLRDSAAAWFHTAWGMPEEAYARCMDDYLSGKTELGWYLCLDGGRIVAGLGVVENDFHDRNDLAPNTSTDKAVRRRKSDGIARGIDKRGAGSPYVRTPFLHLH